MARAPLLTDLRERKVEPRKRMVGGRFGWAVHRFPIKGGITAMEAFCREAMDGMSRPSYFAKRLGISDHG
jgi:hypothetical protein